MRKRTIRTGMRLVLAALALITLTSFYHGWLADLLALSAGAGYRLYSLGIFWAAAIGGCGVILAVFGLVLPGNARDAGVRLLPLFLLIVAVVFLFFYLLASSLDGPSGPERLRPGDTITI